MADDEIGGFVGNMLNTQFSQSNEFASDEYGFKFLVIMNYPAMESAFHKLTTAKMAEKARKSLPIPVLPQDPLGRRNGRRSRMENNFQIPE